MKTSTNTDGVLLMVLLALLLGNWGMACFTNPEQFAKIVENDPRRGSSVTTKELARDTLWQNRDNDTAGHCIRVPPGPAAVDWRTFCASETKP